MDESPFSGGGDSSPPPAMPQPLLGGLGGGILPRGTITAAPLPVPPAPLPGQAASGLAPAFPGVPQPVPAPASPEQPPAPPAQTSPPPPPAEEPDVPRKRQKDAFANVGDDVMQKPPFYWEFRTALLGMICSIPAFLFIFAVGNFNVFGFSFPLMMIGLFTGLAFRLGSRPWSLPMTSLMSAFFTMFIAEVYIVNSLGAAWAEMSPFLYFITTLTLSPYDVFVDTMTHALGGARGYVVGAIAAFWLACND